VTKLNAQGGTATVGFSTFLGGSENEMGQSVAVGADGSIYVGGVTTSANFPGQVSRPGTTPAFDGFVIKLNATGTQRAFSRLFGEDGLDGVYDVAVNAAGNMFVAGTGTLGSTTVNGCGRPGDKGLLGMLKTDGSGWEYLTPFGEVNSQILVDANDTAYVAGWGASGSIPQIGTVAQPTYGGGTSDAYLMKLDKLPNATATGCGPCTGDFGGAGPRACPQTSPKCLVSGECVATGACNTDTDCGGTTSGRVCDAKVCKDGCRGTGGNGCPSGKVCSSTSNAVGTCQNPPCGRGPRRGARRGRSPGRRGRSPGRRGRSSSRCGCARGLPQRQRFARGWWCELLRGPRRWRGRVGGLRGARPRGARARRPRSPPREVGMVGAGRGFATLVPCTAP
jgi:hypothetical protein